MIQRSKLLRWAISLIVRLLGTVVVVVVFTLLLAVAISAFGQITAPLWLKQIAEERIANIEGDQQLELGNIFLSFDLATFRPLITVSEAQFAEVDKTFALEMSGIEVSLSLADLLSEGKINAQSIVIESTRMTSRPGIDSTADSTLSQQNTEKTSPFTALARLHTVGGGLMATFESVRFANFEALIVFHERNESIRLTDGVIEVTSGPHGILASGHVDWGDAQLQISFSAPINSNQFKTEVQLTDVKPRLLTTFVALPEWIKYSEMPLEFGIMIQSDDRGEVPQANWRVRTVQQQSDLVGDGQTIQLKSFSGEGEYDFVSNRLLIERLFLDTTVGSGEATGYLDLIRDMEGEFAFVQGQMSIADGRLAAWRWFPTGLSSPLMAEASFQLNLQTAEFEVIQMSFRAADTLLQANGHARYIEAGWDMVVDFDFNNMHRDALIALWPGNAPSSRAWLNDRIKSGQVFAGSGRFIWPAGGKSKAFASFQFKNVNLEFLKGFPTVIGGKGHATIEDQNLSFHFDEGYFEDTDGERGVNVAAANFSLLDITTSEPRAILELSLNGHVTPFLSLLNQLPLGLFETFPIQTTIVEGQITASGRFDFPLQSNLTIDRLNFMAEIDATEIQSKEFQGGKFTSEIVKVVADNRGVTVQSDGEFRGISISGNWQHEFGDQQAGFAPISGQVTVSPDTIKKLGISYPDGIIRGEQRADFYITMAPNQAPEFGITTNAKSLALAIPGVGVEKPIGEDAQIAIEGRFGNPLEITRLSVSGEAFALNGVVKFKPEGGVDRSEFQDARFGEWLDIAGFHQADSDYAAEITRGRADFIKAAQTRVRRGKINALSKPLRVQLNEVRLTPNNVLNNVNGRVVVDKNIRGDFDAKLNGQLKTRLSLNIGTEATELRFRSDDAGEFLRSTGLLPNLYGGDIVMVARKEENNDSLRILMKIVDVRAQQMPALSEILSMASVIGMVEQLNGDGILFDEIQAEVIIDENQLEIRRAFASGASLGMTLDGTVSRTTDQINLKGVITPLNLANELLIATPLRAIGIGKGDGFGAVSYFIRGSFQQPEVGANPLTILTPGIFKTFFE